MASLWDNLNGDFADSLRALVAESGGRVTLVSGFRSPQRQEQLWADALTKYGSPTEARKWVAPPEGFDANAKGSMHTKGVAVDLGGDLELAHTLAPKYGLFFPMSWEPWHVQPQGVGTDASSMTTQPEEPAQAPDTMQSRVKSTVDLFDSLGAPANEAVQASAEGALQSGVTSGTPAKADDAGSDMSGETQFKGGGVDANRKIGQKLAESYGFTGNEWTAFNNLVMRESGWNSSAANPTSSARGIAQNINGYSADYKEGDAEGQIKWMLNYVKNRYGTPSKAIAFHDKNNWY